MPWTDGSKVMKVELKICMDGFSLERFYLTEAHFQAGYAVTKVDGVIQPGCCSKKAFRPLAKTSDKEEVAIPLVMKHVDAEISNHPHLIALDNSFQLVLDHPDDPELKIHVRVIFVSDFKAMAIILQRQGASCMHYCPYHMGCTLHNAKTEVRKIECDVTFGDLRAYADKQVELEYKAWREAETVAGRGMDGTGKTIRAVEGTELKSNIVQADYQKACSVNFNQYGHPLLKCVPDEVFLHTIIPIEPLHMTIQVLNHRVEFVVSLAHEWGWHGEKLRKDKLPMDMNHVVSAKYKRPLLGIAGQKLWTMLEDAEVWVRELCDPVPDVFAAVGPTVLVANRPLQCPRMAELLESFVQVKWLLKCAFSIDPSPEDVAQFGDRALAHGHYMQEHFPDYKFKPYDHWLICHAWQSMEYFGGIGRLSSIVCEAANAEWKYHAANHQSGKGLKSYSAFVSVHSLTDPNKANYV
jgi:hypothetical protein